MKANPRKKKQLEKNLFNVSKFEYPVMIVAPEKLITKKDAWEKRTKKFLSDLQKEISSILPGIEFKEPVSNVRPSFYLSGLGDRFIFSLKGSMYVRFRLLSDISNVSMSIEVDTDGTFSFIYPPNWYIGLEDPGKEKTDEYFDSKKAQQSILNEFNRNKSWWKKIQRKKK